MSVSVATAVAPPIENASAEECEETTAQSSPPVAPVRTLVMTATVPAIVRNFWAAE
jgi:hypothetical protein